MGVGVKPRERKILGRVYTVLCKMSGLEPTNPCDIRGIARGCSVATTAAKYLSHAVSEVGYGDFDDAEFSVKLAEELFT